MERCLFGLRDFGGLAEDLRRRSLIDFRSYARFAHGFEDSHDADAANLGGILGHIEAHANVRLSAEVIDLIRLDLS